MLISIPLKWNWNHSLIMWCMNKVKMSERHKVISDCISRHVYIHIHTYTSPCERECLKIVQMIAYISLLRKRLVKITKFIFSFVLVLAFIWKMRKLSHSLDEFSWQVKSGPWAAHSIPAPGDQHFSQFCHLETDVCGKTAKLQVKRGKDLHFYWPCTCSLKQQELLALFPVS